MTITFPEDFIWGTATAAHQVEGGNFNSDCWLLEHLPETPFVEPSGDACDHYHRYPGDIALLAELGFNSYRFSVEWGAWSRKKACSREQPSSITGACSGAAATTA